MLSAYLCRVTAGLLQHQRALCRGLDAFAAGEARAGLLVAPTGSGKSRTLASWLAARIADRGERVLWLAHRRTLLGQAATELARCVGRHVAVVAGGDLGGAAGPVHVASVPSVHAHDASLRRWLRRGPAWVVIDEAHHAPARTYRTILAAVARSRARVIGATATPTRTRPSERALLSALFGGVEIARADVQPLVESGVLARATLVRIGTRTVADRSATAADLRRVARTGELSPAWLRRLAEVAPRNELAVRHLAEHREQYGPTIIFAHDVLHAALLTRRLCRAGFRADYATAGRPDGASRTIADVATAFNRGDLDVIVGVDGLDEGVDLVRARTVILVRPTRSEIRLRQCIGRVLRGPAVGGDAMAYVVVLEDQWRRVAGFHSALDLVRDLVDVGTPGAAAPRNGFSESTDAPSLATLERVTDVFSVASPIATLSATPAARIVVRCGTQRHVIPVNSEQISGWRDLLMLLESVRLRTSLDLAELMERCFPRLQGSQPPAMRDVLAVLEHVREHGAAPSLEPLSAASSPVELAHAIAAGDLGERARDRLIQDAFANGSTSLLFASPSELRAATDAILAARSVGRSSTARLPVA